MDRLRMLGSLLLVRRQMDTALGDVVQLATPQRTGFCEVVELGPDIEGMRQGQIVVMDALGGTDVRVNDEPLVVFRHDQVLAVCDG